MLLFFFFPIQNVYANEYRLQKRHEWSFGFSRTLNNLCDSCVEMSLRRWLPEYTAVDISHIISDIHSILYSTDRGVYKGAVVH